MRRAVVAVVLVLGGAGAARADTVEKIGDVGAVAIPVSGLLLAGARHDGRGTVQLAEAYAVAMGVVYVLKPTIDRQRPDGGSQSFPSGHSASAFVGAAFLQRRYGWRYGLPAYALATFVAWSRVEAKRHWTSDVVAGGAIGVASGFAFTRPFRHVAVQPSVVPRGAGLAVSVAW
jgi:membrane-associated phospholipid phosphatase